MKMKKTLISLGCAALVLATGAGLAGCGDMAMQVDAVKDVKSDISYMSENLYNKLTADLTFADMQAAQKTGFYTEIGNVTEKDGAVFKINNKIYSGEEVKLSIGNNKFVVAPRYYVENGKLYVASYLLSLKANDAKNVEVSYNGSKFNIMVAEKAGLRAEIKTVGQNSNNTIQKNGNKYDVVVNNSRGLFLMTFKDLDKDISPEVFVTEKITTTPAATEGGDAKVTVSYGFTKKDVVGNESGFGFYAVGYGTNTEGTRTVDYTVAPVGYAPVTFTLDITQHAQ